MDVNFSNNLFLGKIELDFLKESLREKGFKRLFSTVVSKYGVVRFPADTAFTAMQVSSGTANGKLSIGKGMAINSNQDVIEFEADAIDALTVPGDGLDYYVKVSFTESTQEEGTVDVSATGQLTGSGTKFTEVLRGLPNFPSKIKLSSATNTADYVIASVASDTAAQINIASGQMIVETGLTYQSVGTFTPGVVPSAAERYPLKKDGYTLTLTTSNTITDGLEFILAKVNNNGATTTIADLRASYLFEVIGGSPTS